MIPKTVFSAALIAVQLSVPFMLFAQQADEETAAGACLSFTTPVLAYRSRDAQTQGEVSDLQEFLIDRGFLSGASTGYYGLKTVDAVKKYQGTKGIKRTGSVGSLTKSVISKDSCSDAVEPVAATVDVGNPTSPVTFAAAPSPSYVAPRVAVPDTYSQKPTVKWGNDTASLAAYPDATNRWREKMNIGTLPSDTFVKVLFDRNEPFTDASAQQMVVRPTMSDYDWQTALNAGKRPENTVAVFWGKTLVVTKSELYDLTVNDSHSYTRVIVDKKVIADGINGAKKSIFLAAGNHDIEIEYTNKWHVPSFSFELVPKSGAVAQAALAPGAIIPAGAKVHFVGVYESKQGTITLTAPSEKISGYLVLKSYDDVDWTLQGDFSGLSGIVIDSYHPGTSVTNPGSVKVSTTQNKFPVFYTMKSSCYVMSTNMLAAATQTNKDKEVRCNTSEEANPKLFELMKSNRWEMISFTGEYDPATLSMVGMSFSGTDDAQSQAKRLLEEAKKAVGF